MARSFTVTFDANDVETLVEFWATALDYEPQPPPPGFDSWEAFADAHDIPADRRTAIGAVVDPAGAGPRLLFLQVPEGKTAKNRVHLDVHVEADVGADRSAAQDVLATELVSAGATLIGRRSDETSTWVVLLDPEGNELCVV